MVVRFTTLSLQAGLIAAILAANWGTGPAKTTAVPEPGAIAMLLLGAAGLLARRRHRAESR